MELEAGLSGPVSPIPKSYRRGRRRFTLALLGVLLHGIHPPPLSERSPLGWGLAVLGSGAAVVGALAFLEWAVRSEA